MSVLYIEPFAGVAGDMLLSAFCGLTDGYKDIIDLPGKLNLPDGKIEIQELNKNGIVCKHVKIYDLNEDHKHNHDDHHHDHHHHDHHHHDHSHDHHHDHKHDHHTHPHRHLSDIIKLIDRGDIPDGAKKIAKSIFEIIGKSESKVHGIPLEKIHFHEVSGVDSILDIVGCAVMLDRLKVTRTYADPICVGSGTVKTQHGILPVPAPATADILLDIPTFKGDEQGERTTPTGAAIIKYLNPAFSGHTQVTQKFAYGPGVKDFKVANVVRVSILQEDPVENQEMYVIETQLDDTSGEVLGSHFQEQLIKLGASDVFYTPIQMKKGRPAQKITVLASENYWEAACEFLLEHTPTIGLRYYKVGKKILKRTNLEIETTYGKVKVKETTKPSGRNQRKIEYESLLEISQKLNQSILETQELLYPLIKN
ncbi:MAG: nickel pincer cofactor biosynthesis protein LarC [Cyclobacteriaceae bacterium]